MAPSANADVPAKSEQGLQSDKASKGRAEVQVVNQKSEGNPTANGTSKDAASSKEMKKPENSAKSGELSGKEKKEKAKAEKAARRAKDKQGQQGQPVVDLGTNKPPEAKARRPSTANAPPPISKGSQKGAGTVPGTAQKLPVRPAQSQTALVASEPPSKEKKRVALFDHLYGPPRRNTLAGASKDVHPAVLALGLQMRNYVICGSSARCVATLLVFKRVIESYTTPPQTSLPRHLTTHLSSQIDYLVSCRPLSISMGNVIRWLKVQISAVDVSTEESVAKSDLCIAIDNYIQEKITLADEVIAKKAKEKIKDGDVILTFAKSSIVQQTLVEACREGKKFRVIVVDSRPLFEGKNIACAMSSSGLEVQYSLIHGLDHVIRDATKVFLGAHAMMSTGKLYSRIGTALVAMVAKDAAIPVIVCCESVKFAERSDLDSFVHNEIAPPEELFIQGKTNSRLSQWEDVTNLQLLNLMYDLTPAEYISVIFTEYGPIPPSSVPVIQRLSTGT